MHGQQNIKNLPLNIPDIKLVKQEFLKFLERRTPYKASVVLQTLSPKCIWHAIDTDQVDGAVLCITHIPTGEFRSKCGLNETLSLCVIKQYVMET